MRPATSRVRTGSVVVVPPSEQSFPRRDAPRPAVSWIVLAVVAVIGSAACIVSWLQEERSANTRRAAVVAGVVESAAATAVDSVAALAGSAAIVEPSGEPSTARLGQLAEDLRGNSHLDAVGVVDVVESAQRADVEARLGRPLLDIDPSGLRPAAQRDEHWVLSAVAPADDLTSMLVGVDLLGNELSAAAATAARDQGETLITSAVQLGPELPERVLLGAGEQPTLFFVIKPLYLPGSPLGTSDERREAHVGFVVSAVTGAQLASTLEPSIPEGVRYSVLDGDIELASNADSVSGEQRTREVLGSNWTVVVDDTTATDHSFSVLLLVVTAVLCLVIALVVLRDRRLRSAADRLNLMVERTAVLARRLSAAATVDEVARAIGEDLPGIFGAHAASFGEVDRAAGVIRLRYGSTMPQVIASTYREYPLDAPAPVTTSASTGEPVLVPDESAWRSAAPEQVVADVLDAGIVAMASLPLEGEDGTTVATLGLFWLRPTTFDDVTIATMGTVVELCEQSLARAAWTDRNTEEAASLARLAERLAATSSVEQVTDIVVEHAAAAVLASAVSIGLIDPAEQRLRITHGRGVVDEIAARYAAPSLSEPLAFTEAARTGHAVYVETFAEYCERYPGTDAAHARLGRGARAALPLVVAGRCIGSMAFAWERDHVFDEALVFRLGITAELVAQALQRAELDRRLRADAERNDQLARLARALAEARTTDELCAVVQHLGGAPVGAVIANVGLLDDSGELLVVQPHPGIDEATRRRFARRTMADLLPGVESIRRREPVLVESVDAAAQRYPGRYHEALVDNGFASSAHVPMFGPDGVPIGCVGFAWDHPREFSANTLATLSTITEISAQSLERTRLAEAEHRLVESFHRRVVDAVPSVAGLAVSARYLPSTTQVGLGGDWYDALSLDDGRYAVVVGDVAGHGIGAVADMVELRAVIGAELRNGRPLSEILPGVSSWLSRSETVATACITVVDLVAERISHVSAGHLPPVLRRADGSVLLLEGGRQPILGIPGAPVEPEVVEFPPGSTLVVCTDGLVERRHQPIDDSLSQLARVVAQESTSASDVDELADRLLQRSLGGDPTEDDVALIVVSRTTEQLADPPLPDPAYAVERSAEAGAAGQVAVTREFAAEPASAAAARAFALGAVELEEPARGDVALVTSELATNAILHAGTDYLVRVDATSDELRVAVFDRGGGQPRPKDPAPAEVHGRGLRLIEAVSSAWGVQYTTQGKWVWATMSLPSTADGGG